ncbi:beta-lactamase-like protein [Chytriomyces sp. MP71]|nr:beta-lactamase-like protein [Chytriomyces sp. MP71]KAI8614981.1 beta-lactamase-like protein [Chytriomyces sp. MP71]
MTHSSIEPVPTSRGLTIPDFVHPISELLAADVQPTSSKPQRKCPWYKKLPNTTFTIDAFNCGKIEDCTAYFLSHFHADHYGGLSSKWLHGPIYCSKVTANLVKSQIRVNAQYVIDLPMNERVEIQGVGVTLIDANHCPGAVLFLFQVPHLHPGLPPAQHLHTGDFRALPAHASHALLRETRLASVYLDTTYCDARYAFPAQGDVLAALERGASAAFGMRAKKTLFCVGTYTIGKERVFKTIANAIGSKVFAETSKRRILRNLEDPELEALIVENPHIADVHVIKIGQLNKEDLEKKLQSVSSTFNKLIAIKPTGWTHNSFGAPPPAQEFTPQTMKLQKLAHNIHVIPIPYSEHSSYTELKDFVRAISVDQIIPTVNVSQHEEMRRMFEAWKME